MAQVDSTNVIRLILQFLQENHLNASLDALIKETGVHLNAVTNAHLLKDFIREGKWEEFLKEAAKLFLEPTRLTDVFEQIVRELCKQGQAEAARALLHQAPPLAILKGTERYFNLEELCITDPKAIPDPIPRRSNLATEFKVPQVEQSRLLSLIGQAMKQQGISGDYDPFLNIHQAAASDTSMPRCSPGNPISLSEYGSVTCIAYAPEAESIIVGLEDGFLTLLDANTLQLKKETEMVMESRVATIYTRPSQALVSSVSGELMALVSSVSGELMLWDLHSEQALLRLATLPECPLYACLAEDCAYAVVKNQVVQLSIKSGAVLRTIFLDSAASAAHLHEGTLVVGCKDGSIHIIGSTGQRRMQFSTHQLVSPITAITCNQDYLFVTSAGHLKKYNLRTTDMQGECQVHSFVTHLLLDASFLYAVSESSGGVILDHNLQELNRIPTEAVDHCLLLPSALLLLTTKSMLTPFY